MTLIMFTKRIPWLLACASAALASGLDGTWVFRMVRYGEETGIARLVLKVEGIGVTGKLSDDIRIEGSFQDGSVTLRGTRLSGQTWAVLKGRLTGDELRGTAELNGEDVPWRAHRVSDPEPPKTHQFEPAVFHRFFSSSISPALEINPGDTVHTWTVDSGGIDSRGVRRSAGGNPETGPFYIRGALPGDTLAVTLKRIRPNRDTATSGRRILSEALTARYLLSRANRLDNQSSGLWKLDLEAGYAAPANPGPHMKDFRVKLRPMLGCIAVAPPQRESYPTGWLGSWGGNLDYNGMVEGATVYLPVYHEGALLFLGDGHAAQGDGELTGDALETSMDVEFTVNVIAGQSISGPIAENDEFLMAMGIGNSLLDALRFATAALAGWLEHDYHLTPNETALVLGSSIRYDIAEVADPQMHIVAKISKAQLRTLVP